MARYDLAGAFSTQLSGQSGLAAGPLDLQFSGGGGSITFNPLLSQTTMPAFTLSTVPVLIFEPMIVQSVFPAFSLDASDMPTLRPGQLLPTSQQAPRSRVADWEQFVRAAGEDEAESEEFEFSNGRKFFHKNPDDPYDN